MMHGPAACHNRGNQDGMLSKSRLKYIQTLGQKKFRQQEQCFIAEGPKIVEELLHEKKADVIAVYTLEDWYHAHLKLIGDTDCTVISPVELEKISQLSTGNTVLAIVKHFSVQQGPAPNDEFTLALDTIQDPGNLGTIIRIADWYGIKRIVCSEDTADCYNPKVVQSSMGSIARVGLYYTGLKEWLSAQNEVTIYAAALEGLDITRMTKPPGGILLIGNESKGIEKELMAMTGVRVTIPGKGKAESLNAAVATGIILSHFIK